MDISIINYDDGRLGYVRYTLSITVHDAQWSLIRRFNDFVPLHEALKRSYGHEFRSTLPPRRWFGRFNPDFLRERKKELQDYLNNVAALPGKLDFSEARHFFEFDRHLGGEAGLGRGVSDMAGPHNDALPGKEAAEQARIAGIVDETTRALINITLPLHQVSVEQIDQSELAHQQLKILNKVAGFRDCAAHLDAVLFGSHLRPLKDVAAGQDGGVIDILSAPARVPLGIQGELLEKQGLSVADDLREASQIRARSDEEDVVCHLREDRVSST